MHFGTRFCIFKFLTIGKILQYYCIALFQNRVVEGIKEEKIPSLNKKKNQLLYLQFMPNLSNFNSDFCQF
ncbi:uncharacterized protein DS421_19g655460 [Arachis hypogaea]|uniref:Uncharacterized protein n=1 Tax=Arachis hypogaea TaxID=3818 RepID=A0A6B9VAM2_ARAHY|nr:uncharacterized protein DS421_19g655460 [Arachis hypogaea]